MLRKYKPLLQTQVNATGGVTHSDVLLAATSTVMTVQSNNVGTPYVTTAFASGAFSPGAQLKLDQDFSLATPTSHAFNTVSTAALQPTLQVGNNVQYIRVGSVASATLDSSPSEPNGSPISWPQLSVPAFETRSFEQLIHETDAHLQLEEELEDALVQLTDEFVEQTVEYATRVAKHRGSSSIEAHDMLVALDRYASQSVSTLPQLGIPMTTGKRRADVEAHRQRLALINKKLKKF